MTKHFDLKLYFNFGYTADDLLVFSKEDFKSLTKSDRLLLRDSLNRSYYIAKGPTKDKIGQVLSVLTEIGMGL